MYKVYRKVSNGHFRRILVTNDYEYAVAVALNSLNCHLD